ncbi:hypothetical protein [Nostoc sp.]
MKVFDFYKISLASVFVATPLCVSSLKVLAQTPQLQVLSLQEPAFIIDSGSTNTCPFTISVLPLGKVTYTICNSQSSTSNDVASSFRLFLAKFLHHYFATRSRLQDFHSSLVSFATLEYFS